MFESRRPLSTPLCGARRLRQLILLCSLLVALPTPTRSAERNDDASDRSESDDPKTSPALEALDAAEEDDDDEDKTGDANADGDVKTSESKETPKRDPAPEPKESADSPFQESTSEFLKRNESRANSFSLGFRASPLSTTGPTLGLHVTEGLGVGVAGGSAGLLYDAPAPYGLDATIYGAYPPADRKSILSFRAGAGWTAIGAGPVTLVGLHASAEALWHIEFTPVSIGIDYRPIYLFGSDVGWSLLHLGVVMRYRFPSAN